MNPEKIRQKISQKNAEARSLLESVESRGDDVAWTDEESKTFDSLTDDITSLKTRLDKIEAVEATSMKIDEPVAPIAAPATPSSVPQGTAPAVGEVTPRFLDDPNRGFKTPREFIHTVMDLTRGISVSSQQRDQLMSLRPQGAGPIGAEIRAAVGSDEHFGTDDPHGGFLVPTGFSPDLLLTGAENDPLAGRTRSVPMTSPKLEIPARVDKTHTSSVSGGLTVARSAETVSKTASRMSFETVTLNATGLFGLSYVSEELLQDSPVTFAALLADSFGDEFRGHLFNERLNGTGVGEFEGINNAGCLVTVAKKSGQAADTVVFENVVAMRSRCWGYSNAVWLANHDVFPQLALMESSGGQIIWQPSIREDRPNMLLGRPIFFTEYAETLGDAGDIVLFNGAEYLEGTYQGLAQAESIHVRFVNHERAFKFWIRNAGAPWWRSALTPKKGSSTLSPFVRVAARA